MVEELRRLGCVVPELDTEIADPITGRQLAAAEAFWPEGLQTGQGRPVVLELEPEEADLARLEELDYEVFTSVDALLGFVRRHNEYAAGDQDAEAEAAPEAAAMEGRDQVSDGEAELNAELRRLCERANEEANYSSRYFVSMLAEHGALETAKRLLRAPTVSDGFAALWERGRLDLTVEATVIQPKYAELFTDDEVARARNRLQQFGYEPG